MEILNTSYAKAGINQTTWEKKRGFKMAFIHTLRNRPFVVCFLPSSNYPPDTKHFSSQFHTTFPNLLQQQKQEKKKPTTKNKTKKILTKHPNTVQPLSPLPFLLLHIYYHPTTKPKTWSWCFLTTTKTTKNLSLMLPNNNNNKDTN